MEPRPVSKRPSWSSTGCASSLTTSRCTPSSRPPARPCSARRWPTCRPAAHRAGPLMASLPAALPPRPSPTTRPWMPSGPRCDPSKRPSTPRGPSSAPSGATWTAQPRPFKRGTRRCRRRAARWPRCTCGPRRTPRPRPRSGLRSLTRAPSRRSSVRPTARPSASPPRDTRHSRPACPNSSAMPGGRCWPAGPGRSCGPCCTAGGTPWRRGPCSGR
mmetsp:Transcript_21613/g.72707  ORF Transcript_21613/g.72707 Transcript_21613/m.72707 type:complete len:216 (-) Transcript_21613:37-684(-)